MQEREQNQSERKKLSLGRPITVLNHQAKGLFYRSPLIHRVFALLWISANIGNLGNEMRNTATTWLMTSLNPSPVMVSLIQVGTAIPMVILVLPAGALADIMDRRKIIKFTQVWMLIAVLAMGVLNFTHKLSGELLILLIILQGIGAAAAAPAWDPVISEAVPRKDLPQAVAINAATSNIIRAIGPAIAGFIITYTQPATIFFINAIAYLFVLFAIRQWRPSREPSPLPPENVLSGMTAGLKYVKHSPILHSLFSRTLGFVFPACALWALLPLIARNSFNGGPTLYGILLACLGVGSAAGSLALGALKRRLSVEQIAALDSGVYGLATLALVYTTSLPIVMLALVVAGGAWLTDISSISSGVQVSIPAWVRARATAVNVLVYCASIGLGSLVWGSIASVGGIAFALKIAAGILIVSAPLYLYFGLHWEEHFDLSQLQRRPKTQLRNISLDQGPVLVTVEYHIDPERQTEFLNAAEKLRRLRLRDGATQWGVYRDVSDPSRHIETFLVKSWADHLRLHARITVADIGIEEFVTSFHLSETEPFVNHFISGWSDRAKIYKKNKNRVQKSA